VHSDAPVAVGSPTIVFGLAGSFAFTSTFRRVAGPGFFVRKVCPRMV
jgi:hypothetical protein